MVFIDGDIEEVEPASRPSKTAARVDQCVVLVLSVVEAAQLDGEIFRAFIVIAPCQMGARRGGLAIDNFEKILAFGLHIAIDNDAHIRDLGVACPAAQKRVFAACYIARRPRMGPIIDRHAAIFFQYAPAHFAKQCFLQLFCRRQHGVGIGVFCF